MAFRVPAPPKSPHEGTAALRVGQTRGINPKTPKPQTHSNPTKNPNSATGHKVSSVPLTPRVWEGFGHEGVPAFWGAHTTLGGVPTLPGGVPMLFGGHTHTALGAGSPHCPLGSPHCLGVPVGVPTLFGVTPVGSSHCLGCKHSLVLGIPKLSGGAPATLSGVSPLFSGVPTLPGGVPTLSGGNPPILPGGSPHCRGVQVQGCRGRGGSPNCSGVSPPFPGVHPPPCPVCPHSPGCVPTLSGDVPILSGGAPAALSIVSSFSRGCPPSFQPCTPHSARALLPLLGVSHPAVPPLRSVSPRPFRRPPLSSRRGVQPP